MRTFVRSKLRCIAYVSGVVVVGTILLGHSASICQLDGERVIPHGFLEQSHKLFIARIQIHTNSYSIDTAQPPTPPLWCATTSSQVSWTVKPSGFARHLRESPSWSRALGYGNDAIKRKRMKRPTPTQVALRNALWQLGTRVRAAFMTAANERAHTSSVHESIYIL